MAMDRRRTRSALLEAVEGATLPPIVARGCRRALDHVESRAVFEDDLREEPGRGRLPAAQHAACVGDAAGDVHLAKWLKHFREVGTDPIPHDQEAPRAHHAGRSTWRQLGAKITLRPKARPCAIERRDVLPKCRGS
jgi:hypothetical protein